MATTMKENVWICQATAGKFSRPLVIPGKFHMVCYQVFWKAANSTAAKRREADWPLYLCLYSTDKLNSWFSLH